MTNFDFLQKEHQFKAFSDACIEAEKSISVSPALCALGVRKSAELAVKWLYSADKSLRLPYKDNFTALVYNQSFLDSIDEHILDRLKYIIKLGNFSAHTNTQVTYKEAVLALANLFDFVLFIDYCYGSAYEDRVFDESLIADDNRQKISADEFERLQKVLEDQTKDREKMAEEMKQLRDSLDGMRKQVLLQKSTIPEVYAAKDTLKKVSNDSFWTAVSLPDLEEIRGGTARPDALSPEGNQD